MINFGIIPLCLFAGAFLGIVVIAILVNAGVLNRRLASILSILLVLPFACAILLMLFNFVGGRGIGGPMGPGGFPFR